MTEYRLTEFGGVIRNSDNANIPTDLGNVDRIQFNKWVASGNVPDPAPPAKPPPTVDELYDMALLSDRVLKAVVLTLNDGTFVPGANRTAAALKTIIKAKM